MRGNTPYEPTVHFPLLKAAAPSLRQVPANAFGDSGSNANWIELDMKSAEAGAFEEQANALSLYFGPDSAYPGRSCYKVCKYESEL